MVIGNRLRSWIYCGLTVACAYSDRSDKWWATPSSQGLGVTALVTCLLFSHLWSGKPLPFCSMTFHSIVSGVLSVCDNVGVPSLPSRWFTELLLNYLKKRHHRANMGPLLKYKVLNKKIINEIKLLNWFIHFMKNTYDEIENLLLSWSRLNYSRRMRAINVIESLPITYWV